MIQEDTINLLHECNSGVKMGISSIDEVLDKVQNKEFYNLLQECKETHEQLGQETHDILNDYDDTGKAPNPIAKGMSWIKTNAMLTISPNDKTIADLITQGCNMGVKSLNRYLNQYKAAEEKAKDITKRLINSEEKLTTDIRKYL